ncbi:Low-affinity inorganic phosphate transporter 1 [Sphingomonas sp. EC-HK361]|uniref:inorganic phosphate transporter n=1 Tax=Sphingomonas sp. EC-HK361 TaxID=2038397 RepID=UPI0012540940|nr:inorganic phosphate transporter [Sphingomonas sp. EC-HK361]VVT07640.1 Low-affinity inorganic phosphate transporter 1 [Sphingomonas sp. EC-HK361]
MATNALAAGESASPARSPHGIDRPLHPSVRLAFLAASIAGLVYAGYSIFIDTQQVGETLATGVFLFLGLALLIALGFEFVNGFHDTANAVATVIYTNAMSAPVAVIWSGVWNFIGVMASTGAVAYSIITLLPVDLILNIGSAAGYAMIFALLLAAVGWNLATWYFGIPNSSSHALIGSILGVGVANELLSGTTGGTSGLDMGQVETVLSALLISPLIGFGGALICMLAMKAFARDPKLFREPEGDAPPPRGIRALLVFGATGVSFAHGANDGQKGMGLIMLILIGCAPTAYALNRTVPESATPAFVQSATQAANVFRMKAGGEQVAMPQSRAVLADALQAKQVDSPRVFAALDTVSRDVTQRIASYGSLGKVPSAATPNLRNDMYLVLDTTKLMVKGDHVGAGLSAADATVVRSYQGKLETGTRYIPTWVKVTVALALGLGTMVGWRRIVVTVGEKIGSSHFSYGMGASAQIMAAGTILLAAFKGLPVSTTHILTSGVAGAAVGNGQSLQRRTIINMVLAWFMTLPVAMALSGGLYWLLLAIVHATGH